MAFSKALLKAGFAALLCGAPSLLFAQNSSLDGLFPERIARELERSGKIERTVYMEQYTPELFPKTELGRAAARVWEDSGNAEKPVFYHEGLYLTKKAVATESGANIGELSRVCRSISSLQGIEYYSNTRKRLRVLYEESYAIDSPQSKARIADPVSGSADGATVYAVQKDSTFGRFVYRYDYRQNESEVLSTVANIDALSLMGVKIIEPDNLLVSLLVSDLGDSYLVYTLIETDVVSMSIIENKLKLSFAARAEALYGWLSKVFVEIDEQNALAAR